MKFITVRDFRTYPKKIWDELKQAREMVVTNNGKPIALLTPLMDVDLESTIKAVRQAKSKVSVEKMRSISIQKGNSKISSKVIMNEVLKARKEK